MKLLLPVAALLLVAPFVRAQTANPNPLAAAHVFRYEEMPAHLAPNGNESRSVASGTLATGESIGVHESLQKPGVTPSPLHTIQHSELIVIVAGTATFDHDGTTETAGPGSVLYVALGTLHRIRNASAAPVQYVVIQIGGDTKK